MASGPWHLLDLSARKNAALSSVIIPSSSQCHETGWKAECSVEGSLVWNESSIDLSLQNSV